MAQTIFYASRTHSPITQVIREYWKTSYRVPMAVLELPPSQIPPITSERRLPWAHDIEDLVKIGQIVKGYCLPSNNIEDVAREAGSIDVDEDSLFRTADGVRGAILD